jgi:hypothetical protein
MSDKGLSQRDFTDLVEAWRCLQLEVKEKTVAFEASVADDKKSIDALETHIIAALAAAKQRSVRLSGHSPYPGIAYVIQIARCKVENSDNFFSYVLRSGDTDLLHKRVSEEAVSIYVEENDGVLPPGIASVTTLKLGFRKD